MKSVLDYIKESKAEGKSIDIKSDILEIQIPQDKIQELAKIIKKEGIGNKFYPTNLYAKLDTKDLSDFVCPCELLDASKVYLFRRSSWTYYIEPASRFVPSKKKTDYVKIINAHDYLKDKKINIDDCGYCTKSDDKVLDYYWIQHYSEGDSLNVTATPEQVALAIIIDLSARTAKINSTKQ